MAVFSNLSIISQQATNHCLTKAMRSSKTSKSKPYIYMYNLQNKFTEVWQIKRKREKLETIMSNTLHMKLIYIFQIN